METTDDSRQPLDAADTRATITLESVSSSALLDEVIRRTAERDDLERRAVKAERERDEALGASDALESEAFRARAEVAAEKRVREQVTAERAVVFGDVKALRAVVQGVEYKLADNIDSVAEASFVLRDLAASLLAFTGGGVSLAAAFKAVADLRRERDEARAALDSTLAVRSVYLAEVRAERDEANARIKELEHQGDRRHARILAEEVATLRGQLANMAASRDEAIRQRDRLMHTSLEGWHLLSVAAQRMLATLKGADVDGDVTLDPREIAVMLDCEQRNVADLVRGARARETWQERVREEIRAVTDRVLQVKP